MKVRSIKSTRKLIKGHVYETNYFNNTNTGWRKISIESLGNFSCVYFTQVDGNPLPNIQYNPQNRFQRYTSTKNTENKIGDIIVCNSDKYKFLVKDGKYRIAHIQDDYFRVDGYKRLLKWSYNFRKLTTQESRDIMLSQILDKEENFSVDYKRKFEKSASQDKILIETICKSILDTYRHKLGVVEWGIDKIMSQYSLKEDDFKEILNKPLSEIIKIVEETN